jgi:hypothetical protein
MAKNKTIKDPNTIEDHLKHNKSNEHNGTIENQTSK